MQRVAAQEKRLIGIDVLGVEVLRDRSVGVIGPLRAVRRAENEVAVGKRADDFAVHAAGVEQAGDAVELAEQRQLLRRRFQRADRDQE